MAHWIPISRNYIRQRGQGCGSLSAGVVVNRGEELQIGGQEFSEMCGLSQRGEGCGSLRRAAEWVGRRVVRHTSGCVRVRGTSVCNFLVNVDGGVVHGEERQSSGWSCSRWRAADRASEVQSSAERSGETSAKNADVIHWQHFGTPQKVSQLRKNFALYTSGNSLYP